MPSPTSDETGVRRKICPEFYTIRSTTPNHIRALDWYRRRWPRMTLNGVIALILRFFSPNSIALLANYVTVVQDRPVMSVKYCLPVPVFHFCPKLMHPAARSLCDSWASCYMILLKCLSILVNKTYTVKSILHDRPLMCYWQICRWMTVAVVTRRESHCLFVLVQQV